MKSPLVSICLPVLNAGDFLTCRLESIYNQSYSNWELIAVDNYSNDGTWERLKTASKSESRMRTMRAPREGMYANWNNALNESVGDFIYIATADDTMFPDCLETLVGLATSSSNPCIAQCGLQLIDQDNIPLPDQEQWPSNTEWHGLLSDYFRKPHRRLAPFDGVTTLMFGTVITSITQALIPRQAFNRFGGFPTMFGSAGDMAWEGLAGFCYDIIYTPERLATWRMHDGQATTKKSIVADNWPDRRVAIADWILETLSLHHPDKTKVLRALGVAEYVRFSRCQLKNAHLSKQVGFQNLSLKMNAFLEAPRFYKKYLRHRLTKSREMAETSARFEVMEEYLKSEVKRQKTKDVVSDVVIDSFVKPT